MKDLLKQAKAIIAAEPGRFLEILNPLLQDKKFAYDHGAGEHKRRVVHTEPLNALPDNLHKADGLWIRNYVCRDEVLEMEGELVGWTLETLRALWPVYRCIGLFCQANPGFAIATTTIVVRQPNHGFEECLLRLRQIPRPGTLRRTQQTRQPHSALRVPLARWI